MWFLSLSANRFRSHSAGPSLSRRAGVSARLPDLVGVNSRRPLQEKRAGWKPALRNRGHEKVGAACLPQIGTCFFLRFGVPIWEESGYTPAVFGRV